MSNMKAVFGTMTVGRPGLEGARIHTLEDLSVMLDCFQRHGHSEVDTSRVYAAGSSEEYLGNSQWQGRGLRMQTKVYPTAGKGLENLTPEIYTHSPEDVRESLKRSLDALKADKIDIFYLHAPDRSIPFEVTLREVNQLYQEGHFTRFGISNFMSWEVAEIYEICSKHDWVKPSVYQGIYNALHRAIEPELIPCLRFYGISLYAFQPLAGGFLTDRYHRDTKEFVEGSRFDPKRWQGRAQQGRYWNEAYFEALDIIRPVAKSHGLTESECAFRWLSHHSGLKGELGDAVLIGASSSEQLEKNLAELEKGPLPEDIVQALDDGWLRVRAGVFKYWH
ncbi:hypothetical protein N7471_002377 [Penicillium samsonianum]|uniref:uncharacterized protein n=1 Tax=Penicillium samsonianum TaxID=1882272 RepID=UPI00254944CB|nr:uncharacterized protein N7471_002377 [Penicillium samsonianum]KAJ6142924.1 hypothetical protein N7471_002377 [Penicillium samsonianum]